MGRPSAASPNYLTEGFKDMPYFTNSPYEEMMRKIPRGMRPLESSLPPEYDCRDCNFGNGVGCVGYCKKQLMGKRRKH